MIIVAGIIQFEEKDVSAARPHIINVMRETVQEKGCICYRFCADLNIKGLFQIYEEWETAEDLERHSVAPHLKAFVDQLSAFSILERKITMFEATKIKDL